jgi:transcription initiation factor TFIID subunit 13
MESKSNKYSLKFESDVEEMLYGFGDEWPPDKETVKIIDVFAQQYIEDITLRALEIAELRGDKLDKDCFLYVVRKEKQKFARIQQLLQANEELKQAKALAECDIDNEESRKKANNDRSNLDHKSELS